jgi:hypothetical protein
MNRSGRTAPTALTAPAAVSCPPSSCSDDSGSDTEDPLVGCAIRQKFKQYGWHDGRVLKKVAGGRGYLVAYDDGDRQIITEREVIKWAYPRRNRLGGDASMSATKSRPTSGEVSRGSQPAATAEGQEQEDGQEESWQVDHGRWTGSWAIGFVGNRCTRTFDGVAIAAEVIGWLPPRGSDDALWRLRHVDGDIEDLEEHEMRQALADDSSDEEESGVEEESEEGEDAEQDRGQRELRCRSRVGGARAKLQSSAGVRRPAGGSATTARRVHAGKLKAARAVHRRGAAAATAARASKHREVEQDKVPHPALVYCTFIP